MRDVGHAVPLFLLLRLFSGLIINHRAGGNNPAKRSPRNGLHMKIWTAVVHLSERIELWLPDIP